MGFSFERALVEVWRQALVENAKFIQLGTERYPVRRTPPRGQRQVDFMASKKEPKRLPAPR